MSVPAERIQVGVTTDVVIFTIREDRLAVLLVKRPSEPFLNRWGLPGGFVLAGEGLEQSAKRLLSEKTGVRGVYLEQLFTFGGPDRDPRGRVISVAYYALVPNTAPVIGRGNQDDNVRWFSVGELPELAFDHGDMVRMAQQRLSAKLDYSTIALQFMPEKFTLSQLQAVYETIRGEPLDKRNFRKRLQALCCIEDTGEQYRAGNHRPAKLFRVTAPGRVDIIK